jgi:hypothetical protein
MFGANRVKWLSFIEFVFVIVYYVWKKFSILLNRPSIVRCKTAFGGRQPASEARLGKHQKIIKK